MPKTPATKTSKKIRLRNSYGETFHISKGYLVSGGTGRRKHTHPYAMKLADIRPGQYAPYDVRGYAPFGYSVEVVLDGARLIIGCQMFTGNSAKRILASAKRAQNKLARAAGAGA